MCLVLADDPYEARALVMGMKSLAGDQGLAPASAIFGGLPKNVRSKLRDLLLEDVYLMPGAKDVQQEALAFLETLEHA